MTSTACGEENMLLLWYRSPFKEDTVDSQGTFSHLLGKCYDSLLRNVLSTTPLHFQCYTRWFLIRIRLSAAPGFATLILPSFSITWKDGKGGHTLAGGGEQIA